MSNLLICQNFLLILFEINDLIELSFQSFFSSENLSVSTFVDNLNASCIFNISDHRGSYLAVEAFFHLIFSF